MRPGCIIGGIILFFVIMIPIGYVAGWIGETADVAKKEFGPKAALRKYEWFKDANAQLQKKLADIEVYRAEVEAAGKGDMSHRDVRQDLSLRRSELAGMIASYNALAADYNAASSKFNWSRFEGDIPQTVQEYKR